MKGRTHFFIAILAGSIYFNYYSISANWILAIGFAFALLFGALLPDIDEKRSKISHKLPAVSKAVSLITKHRGIFHSIWIPVILVLLAKFVISKYFVLPNLVLTGFVVGYASHLLADALTVEGIEPFHPLKLKLRGFLKSGSALEAVLVLLIVTYLIIR